MAKFQLLTAFINIGGDPNNAVPKVAGEAITYPEALVLQTLHGGTQHVYDLVVVGHVERSMTDEAERLTNLYGDVVGKIFPAIGNIQTLPEGDPNLPTEAEEKAVQVAADKARAAARRTRTKAETPAPTPAPDLPSDADPDADAAPTLDDLLGG